MSGDFLELKALLAEMALLMEKNEEFEPQLYALFFQHPELAIELIDLINQLDEEAVNDNSSIYSACIFSLDICLAQLQAANETNNRVLAKFLVQLMNKLTEVINASSHSLSFWLPILNAFYEVQVDLSAELKEAYFELANREEPTLEEENQFSHLDAIRNLIVELSDLSIFDIAENFFAQSYAMPPEFFSDLIIDLYQIEEGRDIAILLLLHPKAEIRTVAIETLHELMKEVMLTSTSLSRLQAIRYWYAEPYQNLFDQWLKTQRKKGVVFEPEPLPAKIIIKATEIDGTGTQGIFIQVCKNKENRLCGLLFKDGFGIKDIWVTPIIPQEEMVAYCHTIFEESLALREVDQAYFQLMVEHFLALTMESGSVPSLHFLEVQELLGLRLRPNKLDQISLFNELSIQINPFTQELIQKSLQRSKSWFKCKSFSESWYIENPTIDKIVNHSSTFIDGVKVCRLAEAMDAVFNEEMELNREKWQFHFLWVALWAKVKARKNEKVWQDSFLIAYTIYEGVPLKEIPLMREICHLTVLNSVETMQERKTYLSRE